MRKIILSILISYFLILFLKLIGAIDLPWWAILSPIWLLAGYVTIIERIKLNASIKLNEKLVAEASQEALEQLVKNKLI